MKKVIVVGFVMIATLLVAILLAHIQSLSVRIQSLEQQIAQSDQQVASFERSFCDSKQPGVRDGVTTRYTLESAGHTRTYQVHTPPNYDPSIRYPVIVSFDGIEGSGSRMEAYSDIDALPVIAVYPDSIPGTSGFTAWQGAPYSLQGDYDEQFIRSMLQELPANYCIDSARIFAVGMSNGGGFAMLAGCRLSDTFRAVASVSGAYYASCQAATRQPSLLAIHSMTDKQVPFSGSPSRKLPKVVNWAQEEARTRTCRDAARHTEPNGSERYDWTNCDDASTVRLVVLKNQNHGWLYLPQSPQNSTPGLTSYIWGFFEASVYAGHRP